MREGVVAVAKVRNSCTCKMAPESNYVRETGWGVGGTKVLRSGVTGLA